MYAELHSPIPGHTVSPNGCRDCGMRGLGQDEGDPLDTTILEPPIAPVDIGPVNAISPPIDAGVATNDAPWIGNIFQNVGPDQYLNIQTGQVVPGSIAEQINAATSGAGSIAQTTSTETVSDLVDPTTGQSFSGNLTVAAQTLKNAGQLVDAAGHLTAAGRALASQGNLTGTPATGANFSAAVHSLTSWFTQSNLMPGIPNWGVLGAVILVGGIASSYIMERPKRRRR